MKRLCCALLALVLILSLMGCAQKEVSHSANINGKEYTIDTEQKTITRGTTTYRYDFSGNDTNYRITITYPDGSTYWYSQQGSSGTGGWSEDYSDTRYESGSSLVYVIESIEAENHKSSAPGSIFLGILCIALGLLDIACPEITWYLGYGWRFKGAEPSDAALAFGRVCGGIIAILGIFLLLS